MTRVHDIGGAREYFGPIRKEARESAAPAPWESRVLGAVMAFVGVWRNNVDELRDLMEQLDPARYFGDPYWARWLSALEQVLERHGVVAPGELDARAAGREPERTSDRRPSKLRGWSLQLAVPIVFRAGPVPRPLAWFYARSYGHMRRATSPTRFAVGDRVRVDDAPSPSHTRRPDYVRGKFGVVVRHVGAMDFPDARAVWEKAPPQHVYTVAFDADQLWPDDAEANVVVHVDLFETYMSKP